MAAPPVDCPAECGWRWASTYFGDCVCSDRDIASFVLGLASIAAWGVAELPQIWANFWAGKSEGISFAFIVTWLTARGQTDVSSILYIVLRDRPLEGFAERTNSLVLSIEPSSAPATRVLQYLAPISFFPFFAQPLSMFFFFRSTD